MKNIITAFVFIFFGLQQVSAGIPIGNTENIKIVHEFPNKEDYITEYGRFIDLAILYETFSISGAPLWVTKDPIIVGTENMNTEVYFDIDEPTVADILSTHELNKEELIQLSFMDKHGGFLLVLGVLVAGFIYIKYFAPKEEDEIEVIEDENPKIRK